jgi:hypothetical protein
MTDDGFELTPLAPIEPVPLPADPRPGATEPAKRSVPWLWIVSAVVVVAAIVGGAFAITHYNDEINNARAARTEAQGARDRARDKRDGEATDRTASKKRLDAARADAARIKAVAARFATATAAFNNSMKQLTQLDFEVVRLRETGDLVGYNAVADRSRAMQQQFAAATSQFTDAANRLDAELGLPAPPSPSPTTTA